MAGAREELGCNNEIIKNSVLSLFFDTHLALNMYTLANLLTASPSLADSFS